MPAVVAPVQDGELHVAVVADPAALVGHPEVPGQVMRLLRLRRRQRDGRRRRSLGRGRRRRVLPPPRHPRLDCSEQLNEPPLRRSHHPAGHAHLQQPRPSCSTQRRTNSHGPRRFRVQSNPVLGTPAARSDHLNRQQSKPHRQLRRPNWDEQLEARQESGGAGSNWRNGNCKREEVIFGSRKKRILVGIRRS